MTQTLHAHAPSRATSQGSQSQASLLHPKPTVTPAPRLSERAQRHVQYLYIRTTCCHPFCDVPSDGVALVALRAAQACIRGDWRCAPDILPGLLVLLEIAVAVEAPAMPALLPPGLLHEAGRNLCCW